MCVELPNEKMIPSDILTPTETQPTADLEGSFATEALFSARQNVPHPLPSIHHLIDSQLISPSPDIPEQAFTQPQIIISQSRDTYMGGPSAVVPVFQALLKS